MRPHISAESVGTVRDLERLLRENGFTHREAAALSRGGWDALLEYRRSNAERAQAGLRRFLDVAPAAAPGDR